MMEGPAIAELAIGGKERSEIPTKKGALESREREKLEACTAYTYIYIYIYLYDTHLSAFCIVCKISQRTRERIPKWAFRKTTCIYIYIYMYQKPCVESEQPMLLCFFVCLLGCFRLCDRLQPTSSFVPMIRLACFLLKFEVFVTQRAGP